MSCWRGIPRQADHGVEDVQVPNRKPLDAARLVRAFLRANDVRVIFFTLSKPDAAVEARLKFAIRVNDVEKHGFSETGNLMRVLFAKDVVVSSVA